MQETLIGRQLEIKTLQKALESAKAELVAVTGRRRIGKTFLITQTYKSHIVFEMIGTQNGTLSNQLENFTDQLNKFSQSILPIKPPSTWAEAFRLLRAYFESKAFDTKKPCFLMSYLGFRVKNQVF